MTSAGIVKSTHRIKLSFWTGRTFSAAACLLFMHRDRVRKKRIRSCMRMMRTERDRRFVFIADTLSLGGLSPHREMYADMSGNMPVVIRIELCYASVSFRKDGNKNEKT